MNRPVLIIFLMSVAAFSVPSPAHASDIGWTQNLSSKIPLREIFTDETGKPYRLRDSFSNRPVILTFAYYQCPNLCTLVLNGLTEVLQKIKEKPGKDYVLLTISIDPREKPKLALMKKRTYLARLGSVSEAHAPSWHFLTGETEAIGRVAQAAGFRYRYDEVSDQYAHPSGLLVLSSDGVIRQYFTGIRFDPHELSQAIGRASRFRSGSLVDQILLFCFHYDPASSKNGPRVMLAIRALGMLFTLLLLVWLARALAVEGRE